MARSITSRRAPKIKGPARGYRNGEDNTSHNSLEKTVKEIEKTDTVIYTIGLLSEESKKNAKRAKRALEDIAKASGGLAFFPENVADVKDICENVAHDIRNQYTLAYYPTNTKRDGTFRTVQVEVIPPRGRGVNSPPAPATVTTPPVPPEPPPATSGFHPEMQ